MAILKEFETHFSRFTSEFLLLRCFQQVISNNQEDFFNQALRMVTEPSEGLLRGESLHFSSEVYEKLIQALPSMILRFPGLLNQVLLIRSVSCFEVFLTECLKTVLQLEPQLFDHFVSEKGKKGTQVRKQKLKRKTLGEKIRVLKSFEEKIGFFESQIGMDLVHHKFTLDDLREVHERRHLLVHRDGIVDNKYLDKTGNTHCSIGEHIETSNDYMENALKTVNQAALYVYMQLVEKFSNHQ